MLQLLLQKRGDIYHFRWTIPLDLRPILKRREFTKSLKTPVRLDALVKAARLYSVVEEIKVARREYSVIDQEEEYQKLIRRLYEKLKKDNSPFPENREELDRLRRHYEKMQSLFTEGTLTQDGNIPNITPTLGEMVEDFLRSSWPTLDIDYIKSSPSEYDRFMRDMYNVMGVVVEEALNGLKVETNKPGLPDFLKPKLIQNPFPIELEDSSPLFSEFYSHWLQMKVDDGLGDKIQSSYARFHCDWLELMPDKSLAQYSKKEIRDFILECASAPKRTLVAYKGRPLSELLELDIPNEHMIAPKTADEVRKRLQGVFSLARTEDLITTSPANDLKLKLNRSRSFGIYEDEQVSIMLEAAQIERAWKKWVVWIAAYTGMRRKEIVQLRKEDIKLDSESQRYYIRVTDEGEGQSVKSEAGKRKVPIHRKLKEIGFLDFIADCEDRLFPDLKPQSVTSWFNVRFKAELGIPAFNESCHRLVFHSFRHCVITKALSSNEVVLVQEVVGHEKQQMGITSRYNHTRPLSDLLHVIDCIEYK